MMIIPPLIASAALVALFGVMQGSWLSALWVGLGLAGGIALLKIDELWLHTIYDPPGEKTGPALPLITRSALFVLAYIPMALFIVTSSGSWLGSGLVIGIGLVLLTELAILRQDEAAVRAHFLPHLRTPLSQRDIHLALGGLSLILIFLIIKMFI
jgi:hypothetical protein